MLLNIDAGKSINGSETWQFALIVIGKLVNTICLFFLLKFSAILLTPSELGGFYLLSSFVSFFFLCLVSPVGQYFFRMSNRWFLDGQFLTFLLAYSNYVVLVSVITIPLAFMLAQLFQLESDFNLFEIVIFSFAYVLTYSWFYTVIPIMNMIHLRNAYALYYILGSCCLLAFPILLIFAVSATAESWFVGMVVAMGVSAFIAGRSLDREVRQCYLQSTSVCREPVFDYKDIVKFALPVLLVTLLSWVQVFGFRIGVERELGVEVLGYLGVGLIVGAHVMSVVESIGTQYFNPIFYRRIEDGSFSIDRNVEILISSLLPIYFISTVYVSMFSKEIIWCVASEEYVQWSWVLKVSIWGEFFRVSGNLLSNVAHARKLTLHMVSPYLFSAIFLVVGIVLHSELSSAVEVIVWIYFFGMLIFFILMCYKMNKLVEVRVQSQVFLAVLCVVFLMQTLSFLVDDTWTTAVRLAFSFVVGVCVLFCGLLIVFKLVGGHDNS